MTDQTFTCDMCGGTFPCGVSDEEAAAEAKALFGDVPIEECGTVCDDCFKLLGLDDQIPDEHVRGMSPIEKAIAELAADEVSGRLQSMDELGLHPTLRLTDRDDRLLEAIRRELGLEDSGHSDKTISDATRGTWLEARIKLRLALSDVWQAVKNSFRRKQNG